MFTRSTLLLLILALPACNREGDAPTPTPAPHASLPASLKLDAAPAAPQSVLEARKSAAEGADVVVTGRVKDIVATRAAFTLADMSLKSCADEGDTMNCETPWDYCCEESNKVAEGTTTVEVHEGGALVAGSVQGWNGLDHLKQVVVKGKARLDAKGNLSVIADGIFVQP